MNYRKRNSIIDRLTDQSFFEIPKMSSLTTFFITSTPKKIGSNQKLKSIEKEMEQEMDPKKQLIAVRNELEFRIDELETIVYNNTKDKKQKDKQILDLMTTIQNLRHIRDNSVELNEYQILNEKFEKLSEEYRHSRETIETLNKRLYSESNENELLHQKIDSKDKAIVHLKNNLSQCTSRIKEQSLEILEINGLNEKLNDLQKELNRERDENMRLNELLNLCREEHLRHNESNISVEDLNQSISKFLNSFNGPSVGESLDCVLDIKLSEVESALEEKRREYDIVMASNQDLKNIIAENERLLNEKSHEIEVISQMNEELRNQTKELNERTDKKITEWKEICSQLEADVEQLATDCDFLTEQKTELNDNLNRQIKDLKNLLIKVEKERDSAQNQNQLREKEIFEEKERVLKASEELKEIQTVVNNFKDNNLCLKQSLSEEQQKSFGLENELKIVNQTITKFLNSFNNSLFNESLESVPDIKLSEVQSVFEQKRREYDIVMASNQDLKNIIAENECIIKDKCLEIEGLSQMNEEFRNQTKALNEEKDKNITECNIICSQLETEVQKLNTEIVFLTEQKNELNESLNREINYLKNSLTKVEKDLNSSERQNQSLEKDISEEKERVSKASKELQELRTVVDNLNDNILSLKQSLSEEQQKSFDLQNELKTVSQLINKFLNPFNNSLVGESLECVPDIKLSEVESALQEKRQEYDSVVTSVQDLKNIIAENESLLKEKSHEIEVISQTNEELRNQTNELNEENDKKLTEWETTCSQLETEVQKLNTEIVFLTEQKTELNETLNREINYLKNSLRKVEKERDSAQNQNQLLEKENSEEKQRVHRANEELSEIQTVVDMRFTNFKDNILSLKQSLLEEQQKSFNLENELKNVNQIQSQQMANISKEYEKLICDLKTRLNTEEMSFEFERKNKERYAKENEHYCRKIQCLESEIRELKNMLNKPSSDCNGSAYFCMPTTVNINTNQPNFSNRSVSSMDISNSNCSNISLSISRKLPTGTGSRLIMADEEGEFMNPNHLNALKRGECSINDSLDDEQRMSILQRRNTMVLPHLRSSYAVELPFLKEDISPEEVKHGFNGDESIALKQIQNFSYQRNELISDRRNGSLSCDNISINANKKRRDIENIRITSSKMSLKNMTPTKMFKRVIKSNKSWTPHKK